MLAGTVLDNNQAKLVFPLCKIPICHSHMLVILLALPIGMLLEWQLLPKKPCWCAAAGSVALPRTAF